MLSAVAVPRWTDEMLDSMRTAGDLPADGAITLWRNRVPDVPVRTLADHLVGFENAPEVDRLIGLLSADDGTTARALDPARRLVECGCEDHELRVGEQLFADHGLKILMVLVFYSLPAAYAAQAGVRVLHSDNGSTGFLVKDINRRLIETTQFVIDVLTPGGLHIEEKGSPGDHGRAVRATLRVRLLHATVRALIEAHVPQWDARRFGKPANQEDMAGTLLTFSWLVLDGLRKLSLGIDRRTEEAFFGIWRKVGALLGVDDRLIPANLAEAEALMLRIKERQIDKPILAGQRNEFGIVMTVGLLDFIRQALPFPLRLFRRLPASVMRFFLLPRQPVDVAKSLGIPRTFGLDEFVRFWFFVEARITKFRVFDALNKIVFKEWGGRDTRVASLLQFSRHLNKRLVRHMQQVDRNAALDVRRREAHIDLAGWTERWAFDQADFLTRSVRQIRRRVATK